MLAEEDEAPLRRMADRVESLLDGFDAVSTPRQARELADELARTIVNLYGEGLERVLTIVHDTVGERSPEVFERLCEDRFVESLLCLHGLHPLSVEDRVQAALDGVRPYLKSHEGGVEIASVADGVVTHHHAGQLRRLPVVRRDGEDGGRARDPRARARRPHRGRRRGHRRGRGLRRRCASRTAASRSSTRRGCERGPAPGEFASLQRLLTKRPPPAAGRALRLLRRAAGRPSTAT